MIRSGSFRNETLYTHLSSHALVQGIWDDADARATILANYKARGYVFFLAGTFRVRNLSTLAHLICQAHLLRVTI